LDSLHSQIAIVPQDCSLFNESIAYNIGYANTSNLDQIKWAAGKARIHSLIESLPQGYSTLVGEKGIRLSGGERQRVAIARALIRKPKILCFDEATSSLDLLTEEEVHSSLKSLSKSFTSVIIAHRLSSVTHCDQILVLEAGRVIQAGRHDELVLEPGRYSEMWKQQLEHIK
jgi:ATP-binding cassette subfamily B protein